MRRPSVLFLLSLISGILIQHQGIKGFHILLPYLPLLMLFKPGRKGIFIGLIAFMLGYGLCSYKTVQLSLGPAFSTNHSMTLSGVLEERAILIKDSAFLWTEDPATHKMVKLYIKFPYGKEPPQWFGGEGVLVKGSFKLPKGARNPGGFNEKQWLLTKSCAGILQIESFEKKPDLNRKFALIKSKWASHVVNSLIQNTAFKQGPLAAGMLFGEDSWIDEETLSIYKLSGTNHILSISGAHFAIMLLWIHYLIQKRPFQYLSRKLLVWFLLSGFIAFIGWDIAAMRAFLMFFVLDLLRMNFKQTDGLTSLSVTLSLLLVYNPFSLFDVGLQLASMAMYALLVLAPQLIRGLNLQPALNKQEGHSYKAWLANKCREVLSIFLQSLTVCLCLLPILRNNFSAFTWWSILYNVPVSFMSALILPLSMVQSLFFWNEPAVQAVGILSGTVLLLMTKLVSTVNLIASPKLHYALVGNHLALYYGLLLCPLVFKQLHFKGLSTFFERKLKTGLVFAVILGLLLIQSLPNHLAGKNLRTYFLDVGQGDSTVMISPTGKVILVDTGLSKGMVQVSDALLKMGIGTIDLVILSHPHADHIGGMQRLLEEHVIKTLVFYEGEYNEDETQALSLIAERANQLGIELQTWNKGSVIDIEKDLRAEVYFPPASAKNEDTNDESLVFELRYKEVGILFTGDISSTVEYDIIEQIKSPLWVLKAPHHGSGGSNSTALLSRKGLALAVISVGEHNLYGHPKPATLERYKSAQVNLLRTDHSGAVILSSDGKIFRYQTQLGSFID